MPHPPSEPSLRAGEADFTLRQRMSLMPLHQRLLELGRATEHDSKRQHRTASDRTPSRSTHACWPDRRGPRTHRAQQILTRDKPKASETELGSSCTRSITDRPRTRNLGGAGREVKDLRTVAGQQPTALQHLTWHCLHASANLTLPG